MADVGRKLAQAFRALRTLDQVLALRRPTLVVRDASIQRFEYTYESCWKAARAVLAEREGMEMGSPKACIRASREIGWLTTDQTRLALRMAEDRNLTSHMYHERHAAQVARRLPRHASVMRSWLTAMAVARKRESTDGILDEALIGRLRRGSRDAKLRRGRMVG